MYGNTRHSDKDCIVMASPQRDPPHTSALRFDSPDDVRGIDKRWGAKAKPPVSSNARRLCYGARSCVIESAATGPGDKSSLAGLSSKEDRMLKSVITATALLAVAGGSYVYAEQSFGDSLFGDRLN